MLLLAILICPPRLQVCRYRYGGFLSHGGTPQIIHFYFRIFHEVNHPFWGIPILQCGAIKRYKLVLYSPMNTIVIRCYKNHKPRRY